MNEDQMVYAKAFRRMFPERNDERVVVLGGGHVYDKAERRKAIRMNIGCQRRFKKAGD